jgi:hypothetical protein
VPQNQQGVAEGSKDVKDIWAADTQMLDILYNPDRKQLTDYTPEEISQLQKLAKILGRARKFSTGRFRGTSIGQVLDRLVAQSRLQQRDSGQLPDFSGRATTTADMGQQIALHTNGNYYRSKGTTWTSGRTGQRTRDANDYIKYNDKKSLDDAWTWVQSKGKQVHYRDNFNHLQTAVQIGSFIVEPNTVTRNVFGGNPDTEHGLSVRSVKSLSQWSRKREDITDQQAAALQDIAQTKNINAMSGLKMLMSLFKGEQDIKQIIDSSKKIHPSDKAKLDQIIAGAKNFTDKGEQGVAEGAVKELSGDLKTMSDQEFQQRYKMTKAEARANLKKKNESRGFRGVGGARSRENDENDKIDAVLRQQDQQRRHYEQTGKFWIKRKDTQQHISDEFVGKAAANAAALDMLKQQPELRGNIVITAYGPGESQGVAEGSTFPGTLSDRELSKVGRQIKSSQGRDSNVTSPHQRKDWYNPNDSRSSKQQKLDYLKSLKGSQGVTEDLDVESARERLASLQRDLKAVTGNYPGDDRNRTILRSQIFDLKAQIKAAGGKKSDVAEGVTPASVSKVLRLIDRHHPEWFDDYGMGEVEDTVVDMAEQGQFQGMSAQDAMDLVAQELESLYGPQGMTEGLDLDAMRKAAGLPVSESRILDEGGETLGHIMDRFKHEVDQFEKGGDLDNDLYYALFDYYSDHGEIPYGVAKGRDGDPFEWVTDRLDQELGTGNHAMRKLPEADPISTFEVMSGFDAPVAEGSCNMTAEGEYCPEHALAECGGGMHEMGTVAGSVAPVMGESQDSDALLARIKSLALIR